MRTSILFIILIGLGYMSSIFGCSRQSRDVSNRSKDKKEDTRNTCVKAEQGSRFYFATTQKEKMMQKCGCAS